MGQAQIKENHQVRVEEIIRQEQVRAGKVRSRIFESTKNALLISQKGIPSKLNYVVSSTDPTNS